ncbi:hypothetical protein UVI_02048850 [Ustilaginoidea virens]|uniref:Beta-galactosidase n=1 Tax=Ustilaginoidea virens TaxID=1159556 RepID=A0A1B5KVL5_USTVR|nr:hypothetical protein UVI_02048850 [Ustilaginoidea virens]
MRFSILGGAVWLTLSRALTLAGFGGRPYQIFHEQDRRASSIQDLVSWDEHSLFIHGERAMMFSGEVHPFRLPVPSLYLDVFEKIKALGFNLVSFYVDWALLEGKQGDFRAEGIFDLDPFFDAAKKAGIYLLARPGPYINAEVSGGGFPGYLQKLNGYLRSEAPDYLNATENIIAKHQITYGGPVVLFQPENEYSSGHNIPFPNGQYMQYVINQARSAGISVPMINNDVGPSGNYAPGKGVGSMDIYFQGGAFDPWGGWGFEQCAALVNHEFSRVFYKNNLAAGVTIFSLYMIFGGTNWGNLGHPGGYTSYDYGACIRENRVIDREKYSEVKLQGQFLKVSPGYITASVGDASTSLYSNNAGITITPLIGANNTGGNYFIARQSDYTATGSVSYTLKLPVSPNGMLTIPQRGGTLSLYGRDSKIHLTDYPVGDYKLLYTTAEVFTWKKYASRTVLILYAGLNELHEFAVDTPSQQEAKVMRIDGSSILLHEESSSTIVQWKPGPKRQFIQVGDLAIYLLDRNTAYNYWVPVLPGSDSSQYGTSLMNPEAVIIAGGYLIRSASISRNTLSLRADFNRTSTSIEVVGFPPNVKKLSINGKFVDFTITSSGTLLCQPDITVPTIQVPDLSKLTWYAVDSLPEIQAGYDDSGWLTASPRKANKPGAHHELGNSTLFADASPVSLYGSDYGFYTGALLFRAHFTASGKENSFRVWTSGGLGYASSVWLNDRFVGSFEGNSDTENTNSTYSLPKLSTGKTYALTVVVDSMGFNENFNPGYEDMKVPRGIFDYAISSANGSVTDVTSWKITGNLGGENYVDKYRGPLNEGGFFFERQGYHFPSPPVDSVFSENSPYDGVDYAGVTYYTAKLTLGLPAEQYDIPLSFVFSNATHNGEYRAQLYVNGYQFGKYASNIGPQTEFPVPEGVLNYNGDNWVGLAVWSLGGTGARLPGFTLKAGTAVQSSRNKVVLVTGPLYSKRSGAY